MSEIALGFLTHQCKPNQDMPIVSPVPINYCYNHLTYILMIKCYSVHVENSKQKSFKRFKVTN